MRKSFAVSIIITSIFIIVSGFGQFKESNSKVIKKRHEDRLINLITELHTLKSLAGDNQASKLKPQYLRVRSAYKAWEYLAEFVDPAFVKDYINGSPLPKLERNSFGLNTLEPRGLQVLDDLVFADNFKTNKSEIIKQADGLITALEAYSKQSVSIDDRTVLEATRTELVRLFTLGFTGFDVPGSGNSVPDAITSLSTMKSDLLLYQDAFDGVNHKLTVQVYGILDSCIAYLKINKDFDRLDRLHVLKQFINPLFAKLLYLHRESGLEMIHEVATANLLPPYNHLSDNLFANDFLKVQKYIGLPQQLNTSQTVELGRTLFFDPILSMNNKRACASCHNPDKAFTDGNPKSLAMDFEGTVMRNAPTLINCVYSERFFHDMRAEALEDQIEHVLTSKKEFNTQMLDIITKLSQSEEYQAKFNEAFKDYAGTKISGQTITFAVSAYVSSLRGFNSQFDKYVRGETTTIDPSIKRGFNLFMGKAACGTCHFAPVFNGTVPPRYEESESEVLGVPQNPYIKHPIIDADEGRGKGRLKEDVEFYKYSFKTPTLRNIALTAPYMHNGSYKTLEDVMDFYKKGGGDGIGIKLPHQTLPFDSLSLSKKDVSDIIAFMKSLTDTSMLTQKPTSLPAYSAQPALNTRKIGGEY